MHRRGNIDVQVFGDGHLGLPNSEILAGAGHLLDWDIPRFAEATGLGLGEILPMVTTNPAGLLGLDRSCGTLEPGAPANLVLFRWNGERRLQILETIRSGRVVYSSSSR
jgi:N-acetylglucosamine-6-phosphate deacetylase